MEFIDFLFLKSSSSLVRTDFKIGAWASEELCGRGEPWLLHSHVAGDGFGVGYVTNLHHCGMAKK